MFPKIVVPQNGWFIIMENPINPWMIWGDIPLFSETSIINLPSSQAQDRASFAMALGWDLSKNSWMASPEKFSVFFFKKQIWFCFGSPWNCGGFMYIVKTNKFYSLVSIRAAFRGKPVFFLNLKGYMMVLWCLQFWKVVEAFCSGMGTKGVG